MKSDRWTIASLFAIALNLRPALASVGPVIEMIRADLKLSYGAAGLLTLLPVLCMGVFAPLAGRLHTRMGLRRAIAWSTAALACAVLARGIPGRWTLWLSTVIAGAAIAVLGPLLAAFIKQHFSNRGSHMTTMSAGICLGASMAAAGMAPLKAVMPWNWALASWAVPAFMAFLLWRTNVASEETVAAPESSPQRLWTKPRAYLLLIVFGLQSAVFYALLAWLAPAYGELGLNDAAAGGLLSLMTLMQIGGTLLVGAAGVHQRDRRPVMLLCALLTFSGMIGLAAAPLSAPWLWMVVLGIGTGGLFAVTLILPLDYGATPAAAGAWTSTMLSGGYVIAAVGPYAAGMLRDASGSYPPVFLALAGLSGAVCLLSLALGPQKNQSLRRYS